MSWSEADLEGQPAIQVCIRDNGLGLTVEQRRRAFEPFFTTKSKGTGLGLAITRRIIEAHDGHITIGTDSPKGAEFVIRLPRALAGEVPGGRELDTSHGVTCALLKSAHVTP